MHFELSSSIFVHLFQIEDIVLNERKKKINFKSCRLHKLCIATASILTMFAFYLLYTRKKNQGIEHYIYIEEILIIVALKQEHLFWDLRWCNSRQRKNTSYRRIQRWHLKARLKIYMIMNRSFQFKALLVLNAIPSVVYLSIVYLFAIFYYISTDNIRTQ